MSPRVPFWRRLVARAPAAAKASRVGALLAGAATGQPRWMPRRYDRFAAEGYQQNVVAFRAVSEIARAAAGVPWLLFEGGGQGGAATARELETHPLLALLARPNPLQGGVAFRESVFASLLIAGNAYVEAVGPEGRPPRELYLLRADRMTVIPGPRGLPLAYRYTVEGRRRDFAVDPVSGRGPVMHLKTFNPLDDWYGQSPIEAAAFAIDQHNQAGAWNQALMQNGARPSGALLLKGEVPLAEEQFERLKAEVAAQFSGPSNAGRPLLLEGGLEWREMSFSPKDMDFIEARHTSARDIALAFGMPPQLLGIPGDNTYANLREARLALWENTILPLLEGLRDALEGWLGPLFGADLRLAVDEDAISALSLRRERAWRRVQAADFLTLNEKRAALGYAPLKGGDAVPQARPDGGAGEGG